MYLDTMLVVAEARLLVIHMKTDVIEWESHVVLTANEIEGKTWFYVTLEDTKDTFCLDFAEIVLMRMEGFELDFIACSYGVEVKRPDVVLKEQNVIVTSATQGGDN